MKILKIELQNINSLKSDTPIVIDFEGDKFRDIGLFAITGSTGAGKTTILDAITIAMYHNVPRFNRSNSQGKLEDVVSYGASGAMARVVFANKGVRYEAFWSIRLKSKTGKVLSNSKEEVRLKNLDSEEIIAEQKNRCRSEVERVTQLNYKQFLRSVLLAQGEFAAFLTANANEKGLLLEQITGEDIYKKIGEAVNGKIFAEKKTLDLIKAKINSEDLLSEEQSQILKSETFALRNEAKVLDKEIKTVEMIINWFKKATEITKTKLQLAQESDDLQRENERNQAVLAQLHLDEQAAPFKATVEELHRTEKAIEKFKLTAATLTKAATENSAKLTVVEKQHDQSNKLLIKQRNELKLWLPKLEQVTKLDSELEHYRVAHKQSTSKIAEFTKDVSRINEVILQNNAELKTQTDNRKTLEQVLLKQKNIPIIEQHLTDWNSSLTLRTNNWKIIEEERGLIKRYEDNDKKLTRDLTREKKLFEQTQIEFKKLQAENSAVAAHLQAFDLEKLLIRQQKQEKYNDSLKALNALTVEYHELEQNSVKLDQEQKELVGKQTTLKHNLAKLKLEIGSAEKSLGDSVTILEQERTIISLAEERRKLQEGQPCSLCGSIEHPLVEEYQKIEPSKTQLELERRKKILDDLQRNKQEIELVFTAIKTKLELNRDEFKKNQQRSAIVKNKFNEVNVGFTLDSPVAIEQAVTVVLEELKQITAELKENQRLQKQKNKVDARLTVEQQKVTKLNDKLIKLDEQHKAVTSALTGAQRKVKQLLIDAGDNDKILSEALAEFDLSLPTVDKSILFINELKGQIADFNHNQQQLVETVNCIKRLNLELKNLGIQLKEKNGELAQHKKAAQQTQAALSALSEKRNSILPLKITTEQQRHDLEKAVDDAQNDYEQIIQQFEQLKTARTENKTEQVGNAKAQSEHQQLLTDTNAKLIAAIKDTVFKSRIEVEAALLSRNEQLAYLNVRKKLETRAVELKTLQTKLTEDMEFQQQHKDFELSAAEATARYAELKDKQQKIAERNGEIKQRFDLDQQIKSRNKTVIEEIAGQAKIVKKWDDLMKLLGGSKNAFNIYVQRLTLQNLIQLANLHLNKINPRYMLKMNETYTDKDALNFNLIDHYQADESRLVDTSSGGEKFLISLSLALGLSDLASKNVTVESLFIDEGFGTLDNNTLETVISTLETLQSQGKMIGVISHVENLKERIAIQMQITKKGNGISEITVI